MDEVIIDRDEYEILKIYEALLNKIINVSSDDGLDYYEQGKIIHNILENQ